MSDDNLGNFFRAENFKDKGDQSDSENRKPVKVHGNALFKKAIDILNITQTICDLLPGDDDGEMTKRLMLDNAMIVPGKIRGALVVHEVYSIMMETAVIIKINICQLKTQLWACKTIHSIEEKYLDVLKEEIEAFRMIFIQWVSSFDKKKDLPDEWRLFNDPAEFPDDEEPFDAKGFMENFDPEDE
ncbi:MAG: hypothetical protein H7Z13_12415 [Ferruginibacter sp.]|nr:hypothetical protein [Ferruginibacter sp.]